MLAEDTTLDGQNIWTDRIMATEAEKRKYISRGITASRAESTKTLLTSAETTRKRAQFHNRVNLELSLSTARHAPSLYDSFSIS